MARAGGMRRAGRLAMVLVAGLLACALASSGALAAVPVATIEVVRHFPHAVDAFTEGLVVDGSTLYESTGLKGHSRLRDVDLTTGRIRKQGVLPDDVFGEGLARVGNHLVQLTWKLGIGVVYDIDSFRVLRQFRYRGEGWGLTFDGHDLVMSNGSNVLQFLDPESFEVVRRIKVHTAKGLPVDRLNELEYINGEIWANIRFDDVIARINPATGLLIGYVDARALRPMLPKTGVKAGVMNGIAWDAKHHRLYLTGKNWPWLFEVAVPGVLP